MGCLDVNYGTVGNLMRAGIDQARKTVAKQYIL